jgi:hypothetical protein
LYGKQESKQYRTFKKEGEKMKNLLKCSSLIRVAVLMVVMAFMASQMTGAYADKPHKHKGKPHKIKLDEHDADIKEAIKEHDTDVKTKLDDILAAVQNGGGGCLDAPVEKTGQTTPYGTGDDGTLQRGVAWPASPDTRFTDNGNGTITDNLTHLIWDKNANRFERQSWSEACAKCNALAEGAEGAEELADGSVAGDWRLANIKEYQSLIHYGVSGPAVPDTDGTGKWTDDEPFNDVISFIYWSSTTYALSTSHAWSLHFNDGEVYVGNKTNSRHVWCVRGGQ